MRMGAERNPRQEARKFGGFKFTYQPDLRVWTNRIWWNDFPHWNRMVYCVVRALREL